MDHGTLSGIITGLLLLTFTGIVIWAWSGRAQRAFEEAARLPLESDFEPLRTQADTEIRR
jgi:cytochrome c oxidase cbb3-type subunit 4